ncbi:MAG TPA: C4-dicarboxylate ABC transporter, partial [Azospirillum sp.]|nr:C4-dicarboxylate ABC transporter [Azospirillum sp.]
IIMVGIVIVFPELVLSGLDRGPKIDPDTIKIEIPTMDYNAPPPFPGMEQPGGPADPNADIMKQLQKQ